MPLPLHSTGAAEAATVRATRATKLRDTDAVTERVVEMEAEKDALFVNLGHRTKVAINIPSLLRR